MCDTLMTVAKIINNMGDAQTDEEEKTLGKMKE